MAPASCLGLWQAVWCVRTSVQTLCECLSYIPGNIGY